MNDDLINRINALPDILASCSNTIDELMIDVGQLKNVEEINKSLVAVEKQIKEIQRLIDLLVKDTGRDCR